MLKLQSHGGAVINTDDFYIYHKSDGLDELIFNLSIYDENYPNINEEDIIEYEQPYLVKAIDGGGSTAKIKCQIDLDELKATLNTAYTNNSDTVYGTITGVLPAGWIALDKSGLGIRRTIEGQYTPYDVIMQCPETYGVVLQFRPKQKQVIIDLLGNHKPMGAFVSRDLNLKEINYKGKSTEFYTRLYAYGKNGLSFADINDGKPYVDNFQYTDKIICAYWQDDRYEVAENLLADAKEQVRVASIPDRSYACTVMDLAKTNPDMYGFEDFQMFTVVRLIDDIKNVSINYQVAEYWEYPYYPEKNVVTLSSAAPKIQNTVQSIKNMIDKPQTSPIWSYITTAIENATNLITGAEGGYVVIKSNALGQPEEILIMDTPDISTAQNVWRWNQNGFGHSSNGYNGTYNTAITIDGQIVADFIVAGTMLADRIKGGTLIIGGNGNENGVISIRNGSGVEVGRWDKDGITVTNGEIGGWKINPSSISSSSGNLILESSTGKILTQRQNGNKGIEIVDDGMIFYSWALNGNFVGRFATASFGDTGLQILGIYADLGDALILGQNTLDGSNYNPYIAMTDAETNGFKSGTNMFKDVFFRADAFVESRLYIGSTEQNPYFQLNADGGLYLKTSRLDVTGIISGNALYSAGRRVATCNPDNVIYFQWEPSMGKIAVFVDVTFIGYLSFQ